MSTEDEIRIKYRALSPSMNERVRRLWAGSEAGAIGRGGITCVHHATGLAMNTIIKGMREGVSPSKMPVEQVRQTGGGRKLAREKHPDLERLIEGLIDPLTRGDPESPLRWTSKSTRHLARELNHAGYVVSHALTARFLSGMGYSLQANIKTQEGSRHPDRHAQFEFINRRVKKHMRKRQPAISVDTKKKELVGSYKNRGEEWRPVGKPIPVKVHDFIDKKKGKAIPYGVYDLTRNQGWVSVGVDHDTAAFAVATIRKWWRTMGRRSYPEAASMLIIADSGGSNGTRVKLWKWELQKLSNLMKMEIRVSHLPPGTSKWNKIEHRLFSFISQNWRGKPLINLATIVSLIAATKTTAGLNVRCAVDRNKYPRKVKVTPEQMSNIRIKPEKFHGDWNYTIVPTR